MTINAEELNEIADRVEKHINDIEGRSGGNRIFALRPGQIALARGAIHRWKTPTAAGGIHDHDYFVRPTGTGKTVSLIDMIIGANMLPSGKSVMGDRARGKRAVVMVPQNFLLDQWENELLGKKIDETSRKPSKWGNIITREHVGIYRATDTEARKRAALQKPIVVVTYDSARKLSDPSRGKDDLRITPKDFSMTILDEVHDRPRGDVTGAFIRERFYGQSLVIGATATDLYKSGKTIGDYLFGGEDAFHRTTFREAVNRGEICPMRNIIAEVQLDAEQRGELKKITDAAVERARKSGLGDDSVDYTEKELEKIVEITQRDEAAIRLLQRGFDPDNGKKYRDMKQVWYCASIKHAHSLAKRLNEEMGSDYAVAVDGQMTGNDQSAVLINYRDGKHKAVTNCQLLTMGFDDREAELCMQMVPTRSPIRSLQQGGRVMRIDPNNPAKIANIVTFVYPGIEQVVFGELAQGMVMIPEGYKYGPPSSDTGTGVETRPWLDIEGLKVYYTTEQYTLFAEDREKQRFVKGLHKKTDDKLNVKEMARALFPNAGAEKLERETERLQSRLYDPLKAAYDIRESNEKYVGLNTKDDGLSVCHGRYPVWYIGYYSDEGKPAFCIDKKLDVVCKFGMYGLNSRVGKRPSDWLSEKQVKGFLDIKDVKLWHDIIEPIKDAYLDRGAYDERDIKLGNVNIRGNHVGFFNDQGSVAFCMRPDALLPLYQLINDMDQNTAEQWWKGHKVIQRLKTSAWLDRDDTMDALGIRLVSGLKEPFKQLWDKITLGSWPPLGKEGKANVKLPNNQRDTVRIAKKQILDSKNTTFECVHRDALNLMRHYLGMESDYKGPPPPTRDKS